MSRMNRSQVILLSWFTVFFAVAEVGFADPATGPSTAPAAQENAIESDSPRDALKRLAIAMDAGDAETIRSLFVAPSPREEHMVSAMADLAEAFAKVRTAAAAAYGADRARIVTNEPSAKIDKQLAAIASADESINGDQATLRLADPAAQGRPTFLQRVDGQWKILLGPVTDAIDPVGLDEIIATMALESAAIHDFAAELGTDKYKTPEEAAVALRGAVMRIATQGAHAATRPATEPAIQPSTQPAK